MLQVKRFVNELMSSNCYLVYDEDTKHCLVIDPASEMSLQETKFIEEQSLILDYIILTHEHTDHTWGVNSLKEKYPNSLIICSEACNKYAKKASQVYFLLYYDDPNYHYIIKPADILIMNNQDLKWGRCSIHFILTPGHSFGSMVFYMDNLMFTGDTIMPFKPYFNGRDSNEDEWKKSISWLEYNCSHDLVVMPGHGDSLSFRCWLNNYNCK